MIFCGQCGLQLAPGITRCPRCGTQIEEPNAAAGELHTDDQTIASPSFIARNSPGTTPSASSPGTAQAPNSPQPPLILRPGAEGADYGTQAAYGATSRVESPNYGTVAPNQNAGGSYTGYPQSGGNYPPQGNYPDYSTHGAGSYPGTAQFPPQSGMGYPTMAAGQYPQEQAAAGSRMRTVAMVVVLLGLMLILVAVVLFALQHSGTISLNGGNNTPPTAVTTPTTSSTPTATPTLTATQQGEAIIGRYYDDINKQNYHDAYIQWKSYAQNEADFSNGFKNTKHDQVTFDQVNQQQDGTVKLTVTVNATEASTAGDKQQTYKGYYVVGKQDDGSWKIVDGKLQVQ